MKVAVTMCSIKDDILLTWSVVDGNFFLMMVSTRKGRKNVGREVSRSMLYIADIVT